MASLETSRMPFVDSLRMIAAGLVLIQHVADRSAGTWLGAVAVLSPGIAGVVLFFLISGFVIPLSVRRGLDPSAFTVRRLLRIYPLYLAALVLAVAGGALGWLPEWAWVQGATPGIWLANLLLVQDLAGQRAILGVSWTLIIELGWYGLFAAAVMVLHRRAADVLILLLPTTIFLLALASLVLDLRIPLARPGMIYAAALGYQAFRYHSREIRLPVLLAHAAGFLSIMTAAILVSFGHFHHAAMNLWQVLGPWLVMPGLFLLVVVRRDWQAWRVLSAGLLPKLGESSYSLYLLHPLAIALAYAWLPGAAAAPTAVIGAVVAARAGFRWIERPGIAFGRWLMRPPPAGADERPARIGWLDAARGCGIVLVVFGHALGGLIDSRLGAGLTAFRWLFFAIYTFHMPLFFLLAGLMVPHRLERDAAGFVRGLGTGIVAPYFLWSALQFTVIAALGTAVNNPVSGYWPTILALPWKTVSQFWFLYVLFWLHLIAAAVVPRWGAAVLLVLAMAMKLVAPTLGAPVVVRLVCAHALFYAIGVVSRPEGVERLVIGQSRAHRVVVLVALALSGLVATFVTLPWFGADLPFATASSPQLANLAWRLPVLPVAGIAVAACLGLAGLPQVAGNRALAALGRLTMPVFVMHVLFVAGTRITLLRLGLLQDPFLLAPVLTIAGIAGPLLAAWGLRRLGLRKLLGF